MECIICKKELTGKQSKYCSINCKNQVHQSYPQQQFRGKDRKLKLIELKGGKCIQCGYNKNYSALCFHHLFNKSFKLDMRNLSNRTWESILTEVDKCILLCMNCHSETHNKDHLL